MRIAVVSSPVTALRPAQLGGAQAFVCDLARGLTERGHDVTLHCASGSEVAGVRLVTVPAPRDAAVALVMPGGSQPPPAPGVARALDETFRTIRAMKVDVISQDRKSTRLNSSHANISYAVFCLKKKKT